MGRPVHDEPEIEKHTTAASKAAATAVHVEDKTCPICQEPTGIRNAEGIKEGWSLLPCGHRFGSYCIKRYLGITADDQPLCPVCRQIAYHDVCGHPVLPFVLNPGKHQDKAKDSTGKPLPPTKLEELMSTACNYCNTPADERTQDAATDKNHKMSGLLSTLKIRFRWLRGLLPPALRKRVQRESLTVDSSSGQDSNILTRQEARTRRRTPATNGSWQGPWMDVQTRDAEWEEWWKNQYPQGV